MKKKILLIVLILILFIIILVFMPKNLNNNNKEKMQIIATLFPQYDFVKQIGQDRINVELLLPSGVESHTYEPTPQDIIKVNNSDVFLYTGKNMEPWAETIIQSSNSETKIVDLSKNINMIQVEHYEEHEYNESLEHHEEHEADPHIWLDIQNAIIMVKDITNTLCEIDSLNAEFYKNNSNKYIEELEKLDEEFQNTVENSPLNKIAFGGTFAYTYFVQRYNIQYISAYDSCRADSEPSVVKITEVIKYIKENNLPVIFYQELSEGKIAKSISDETGVKPLVFHTAHNVSKSEIETGTTYLTIMKQNLTNLSDALKFK